MFGVIPNIPLADNTSTGNIDVQLEQQVNWIEANRDDISGKKSTPITKYHR